MEPTAAQRAILLIDQLKAAMDRHRWCWSCGAKKARCDGWARSIVTRSCCPDCRHPGWPEGLDLDPDPEGTLPTPEILAADPPAHRGWRWRLRLPGWPRPGTEADVEIRRMRGN